jgi:hypothetical protein
MRHRTLTVLPLAAVLTLTGCINTSSTTPATSPSSSASSSTAAPATGNPAGPEDDATVIPVPPADARSHSTAIAAAEHAVTTFARPNLPAGQWIDELYPLLSQTGAAAHEGTDPQNIPAHQVTGNGTVLPDATDVALLVEVPTDAGLYVVSLSRSSTDAVWLADRIRPAEA